MRANPDWHRGRSPMTALALSALVATGCSGQGAPGGSGPEPTPTMPVLSEAVVTCAQLVADPDGLGVAMGTDRIDGLDAGAGFSYFGGDDAYAAGPGGQPVVLLVDGTRIDSYVGVFEHACGRSTAPLAEYRALLFADTQDPGCMRYLEVEPDVQGQWIAQVGIAAGQLSSPTQEQVTAACIAAPAQSVAAAVTALLDGEVPPTGPVVPTGRAVLWQTTSSLGYAMDSVLEIGALQVTPAPHPDATGFEVGSACGFDPETDALLPLTLTVTNATPDFDARLNSRFIVAPARESSPETIWVSLVTYYGDTVGCEENVGGRVTTQVIWDSPTVTGYPVQSQYFVVLHDYFSPAFPTGNAADLGRLVAEGQAPMNTGDEDPVTLTTPGAIHLDRTPAG